MHILIHSDHVRHLSHEMSWDVMRLLLRLQGVHWSSSKSASTCTGIGVAERIVNPSWPSTRMPWKQSSYNAAGHDRRDIRRREWYGTMHPGFRWMDLWKFIVVNHNLQKALMMESQTWSSHATETTTGLREGRHSTQSFWMRTAKKPTQKAGSSGEGDTYRNSA